MFKVKDRVTFKGWDSANNTRVTEGVILRHITEQHKPLFRKEVTKKYYLIQNKEYYRCGDYDNVVKIDVEDVYYKITR